MWVLVKYEGEKFIAAVQKKVNGQYNVCCWKSHWGSIFHKKKSEVSIQFSTKMFMEQISNLD